ncbi:hypothetical protein C8Q76DRAFT_691930 [Earliella scabrosa]|nr:hypothetical protein C8Q76DRAFT_691930 [Earliella scabrosa]
MTTLQKLYRRLVSESASPMSLGMISTKSPALLLFALAVRLATRLPAVGAQTTTAVCDDGFDWMNNTKGQSPCLTAAYLLLPCNTPAGSKVGTLGDGASYVGPRKDTTYLGVSPCRCSTVYYSLLAACATCQGGAANIRPWLTYSTNCTNDVTTIADFPANIPGDTGVPVWAYQDVNGFWDAEAAEALASQNQPDKTATVAPSSSSTSAPNPGATGGPDDDTSSGNSTSNESSGSNIGPIVGGVVGGVVGALAIGLAIFFYLRSKRVRTRSGVVDLGDNSPTTGMHEPAPQVLSPFTATSPSTSRTGTHAHAPSAVMSPSETEFGGSVAAGSSSSGYGGGSVAEGPRRTGKAAYMYEAIPPPAYSEVGSQ